MINKSLEQGDSQPILMILQSRFGLRVIPECAEAYFKNLSEAKNMKTTEGKKPPEQDNSTCPYYWGNQKARTGSLPRNHCKLRETAAALESFDKCYTFPSAFHITLYC